MGTSGSRLARKVHGRGRAGWRSARRIDGITITNLAPDSPSPPGQRIEPPSIATICRRRWGQIRCIAGPPIDVGASCSGRGESSKIRPRNSPGGSGPPSVTAIRGTSGPSGGAPTSGRIPIEAVPPGGLYVIEPLERPGRTTPGRVASPYAAGRHPSGRSGVIPRPSNPGRCSTARCPDVEGEGPALGLLDDIGDRALDESRPSCFDGPFPRVPGSEIGRAAGG